jgi:hypothetical protein
MLDFDFFTSGSAVAAFATGVALAGSALAGAAGAAAVAAFASAGLGSAAYAPLKPKQMANKETIRIILVIIFSKKIFFTNQQSHPTVNGAGLQKLNSLLNDGQALSRGC